MNCDYGVYYQGMFYGFETEEQMQKFIEQYVEEEKKLNKRDI